MIDSGNTLLILGKWAAEETLLVCQGTLRNLAFALTGTVASVTDELCTISSQKGEAKLSFRLNDAATAFEYFERRAAVKDISEDFAEKGRLLVFFPPRFSLEEFASETTEGRDSLAISELHPSEVEEID